MLKATLSYVRIVGVSLMIDTDTEVKGIGVRERSPPVNEGGEYVCGRACQDGSRCLATISIPYIACWQHDQTDLIVEVSD